MPKHLYTLVCNTAMWQLVKHDHYSKMTFKLTCSKSTITLIKGGDYSKCSIQPIKYSIHVEIATVHCVITLYYDYL